MKFNFQIKPYLIKEPTIVYVELANKEEKYPLACVGKDSYVWDSSVNTGLQFTIDEGYTTHNLQIGNFNSLADGIEFCLGINHAYTNLYLGVSKLFEENRNGDFPISNYSQKGQIIIQNDVWIGHNSTIMPGVIIHDGAVVAANSHVVKDVPPYAIVGGNPAKIIKYRFSQEIIDKLLCIKWWNWSEDEIKINAKYFNEDIMGFCDVFYGKYRDEKESINEYETYKAKHNFLFFVDFTESYYIFERVIEQFVEKYRDSSDYQLILFIDKKFADANNNLMDAFYDYLAYQLSRANIFCILNVCIDDIEKSRSVFKVADYYITNRSKETILYSGYADDFNVKIISGVDTIIF